ncbi:hypothetical protein PhCBS80983_g04792 [Powellomyces hirtus]|uniref:Uncharacterized protein n=1 Tax=Powellomyces hirtus TaxID=109895 RepID=A0A507DWE0_9FUNG|nr:hypothetical protein PhCBS80983_g04792 [Powellomyces hirtus]
MCRRSLVRYEKESPEAEETGQEKMAGKMTFLSQVGDGRCTAVGVAEKICIPDRLRTKVKSRARDSLSLSAAAAAKSPPPMLTHDDFFPEPRPLPSPPASNLPPPLPTDESFLSLLGKIDITRITDRVISAGMCWAQRSDRRIRRNNINDLARFVNTRYPGRYMIWNLASDTSQGIYDTAEFGHQVVSFPFSKAYSLSIATLFDVCRSIHAWLQLDPLHVAVVQCPTGLGRSAVAIACYLRYADVFADAADGFDYFIERRWWNQRPADERMDGDQAFPSWATVAHRRYVQYFNNMIILGGVLPNAMPLLLQRVVINGLEPVCPSNPHIELYQSGKLIYTSLRSERELAGLSSESRVSTTSSSSSVSSSLTPTVRIDSRGNLVFRIGPEANLLLGSDIQLRLFHTPDPVHHPKQINTIASLSFHAGFMLPGVIRVGSKDLEISEPARIALENAEQQGMPPSAMSGNSIGHGFCFYLMFADRASTASTTSSSSSSMSAAPAYLEMLDRSMERCLSRLVCHHKVRPKEDTVVALMQTSPGYSRVAATFSLQRAACDLPSALCYIQNSQLLLELPSGSDEDLSLHTSSLNTRASKSSSTRSAPASDHHHQNIRITSDPATTSATSAPAKYAHPPPITVIPPHSHDKQQVQSPEIMDTSRTRSPRPPHSSPSPSPYPHPFAQTSSSSSSSCKSAPAMTAYPDIHARETRQMNVTPVPYHFREVQPSADPIRRMEQLLEQARKVDSRSRRWGSGSSGGAPNEPSSRNHLHPHDSASSHSDASSSNSHNRSFRGRPRSGSQGSMVDLLGEMKRMAARDNGRSNTVGASSGKELKDLMGELDAIAATTRYPRSHHDEGPAPWPMPPGHEMGGRPLPPPSPAPTTELPSAPAPPPPASAPPPPPPPPPPPSSAPQTAEDPTAPVKPRVRARIHWDEIRDIEGSVWSEISEAPMTTGNDSNGAVAGEGHEHVRLDVQRFEELFCVVPEKTAKEGPKMVQRTQFTNLLDLRRANNVSIGLSRFTRRGLTTQNLITAVRNMDCQLLSADDLTMLQKLLPTPEEQNMLTAYLNSPHKSAAASQDGQQQQQSTAPPPLAPAEQFMSQVMQVPHMAEMCVAQYTASTVSAEMDEMENKLDTMIDLSTQLRTNDNLKTLLRSVLELGNLTNYDYAASAASSSASSFRPWMGKEARAIGLKVDGLARLKDVKSRDGKWSLMTFLVDMVAASRQDVLDVPSEIDRVRTVARWDLEVLVRSFKQLQNVVASLSAFDTNADVLGREYVGEHLGPLLDSTAQRIAIVQTKAILFWEEFTRLAKYLGEDIHQYIDLTAVLVKGEPVPRPSATSSIPARKMPTHLFAMMDSFLAAYGEAVADWRRRGGVQRLKELQYRPQPRGAAAAAAAAAATATAAAAPMPAVVSPASEHEDSDILVPLTSPATVTLPSPTQGRVPPPPPPPPPMSSVPPSPTDSGATSPNTARAPPPEMARLFRRFSKRFLEGTRIVTDDEGESTSNDANDNNNSNALPRVHDENGDEREDEDDAFVLTQTSPSYAPRATHFDQHHDELEDEEQYEHMEDEADY